MAWAQRLNSKGVRHVTLEGGGQDAVQSDTSALAVFWQDERPVGQAFVNAGDSFVPPLHTGTAPPDTDTAPPDTDTAPPDTDTAPPDQGPEHSASVIICTRDRPQELARCLRSLPEQTRPPVEVIVVDNASTTDATERVCREADVRYVREPRPGLDRARNAGARAASSDIVAYTDDDCILHPYWLERLVEAFDVPDIMAVTGLVLPAELSTVAQWHFERRWGFGRGFERRDFGHEFFAHDKTHGCPVWTIGAGASMAFRRSVFEAVGYFDERLDVGAAGCSGDSEFWHRILTAGGRCRYEPSAVAFHFHRRDMEGLKKQVRAYMRGHAAALLIQYERTGNVGNLRRLFFSLPRVYARRLLGRVRRGCREADLTREEIAGIISGTLFYLRTSKFDRGAS